jgi:hypothetical protein
MPRDIYQPLSVFQDPGLSRDFFPFLSPVCFSPGDSVLFFVPSFERVIR